MSTPTLPSRAPAARSLCADHTRTGCAHLDAITYFPRTRRGVFVLPDPSTKSGTRRSFRRYSDLPAEKAMDAMCAEVTAQLARLEGDVTLAHRMADLVENWIETGGKDSTTDKYLSSFNAGVPPAIRETYCKELTGRHLQQIFDTLNATRASENKINGVRTALGALVSYSEDNDLDVGTWAQPGALTKRRKAAARKARKQAGEAGESGIELDHCPTRFDVEKYADELEVHWPGFGNRAVTLSYATGMRPSELIALGPDDVTIRTTDLVEVAVTAQASRKGPGLTRCPVKNSTPRTTIVWECYRDTMTGLVAEAIERGDGVLLPLPDLEANAARQFEKLRRIAKNGVSWRWTHRWLRHAFASVSMAPTPDGYGYEDTDVSAWLGHHDTSFTRRIYVHRRPGNPGLRLARSRKLPA